VSKRGRDLSDDEKQLWRRVVERVTPRKAAPKRAPAAAATSAEEPPPKRISVRPRPESPPPAAALREASAPPPANRGNEKRVRRGKLEIGATLDLHGHTQASGQAALLRFVRAAQRRGDRTVIVVTGVGRSGEGVLRQRLPEWLAASEMRVFVSGFAQAHRSHGGAGAFYVFLKKSAK
jgi:DNA-nicking Smr family endonuclease